jgi:hypothetical protein
MFIPERFDLPLRQQGSSEQVDGLLTVFISEEVRIQAVMNQSAMMLPNWMKRQSQRLVSIVFSQWKRRGWSSGRRKKEEWPGEVKWPASELI